jgi:flagellar motor switch protein FliN/FliY
MSNRFLDQEEIDALLNARELETHQPEIEEQVSEAITPQELAGAQPAGKQKLTETKGAASGVEHSAVTPAVLTDEEMDALGEVGNICMGSSSTALSLLLNQPVNITSPKVSITSMEELIKSFVIPHISIYVHYTEGFSGYNLLIMKLTDAAIMADLMMGGDGTNVTGELDEIGISAASEAMNQMIGAASTAMSTMFNCTVNISPPETKIYYNTDDIEFPEPEQVVVVWFKMTISNILDTQIMQVMDIATAREEAGLLLGHLSGMAVQEYPPAREEPAPQKSPDKRGATSNHALPDKEENAGKPLSKSAGSLPPEAGNSEVATSGLGLDQRRLDRILDIPLKVTVLLGRTKWPIKDILDLKPGSVVELQSLVDEPVEVLVNGTLVAMGEVVVVNENFGVRLTSIIEPEQRLQRLR